MTRLLRVLAKTSSELDGSRGSHTESVTYTIGHSDVGHKDQQKASVAGRRATGVSAIVIKREQKRGR